MQLHRRLAHARRAARRSSAGDGASSTSFWCRRWIEHSRSPRWIAVAVPVAEDLELDVARLHQVLLQVDGARPKPFSASWRAVTNWLSERLALLHDPHAAAAAARRRLEDDRIADLLGHPLRLRQVLERLAAAGQHRHPGGGRRLPRLRLVAHQPDARRARPDPAQLAVLQHLGEVGVLGQKAVAGMDRVGAGDLGGGDQARDVEIALSATAAGRCRPPRRRRARAGRPRRRCCRPPPS